MLKCGEVKLYVSSSAEGYCILSIYIKKVAEKHRDSQFGTAQDT